MLCSNAEPARLARTFDLRAVTDVTDSDWRAPARDARREPRLGPIVTADRAAARGFSEMSVAGVRSSLDPSNRARNRGADWTAGFQVTARVSRTLRSPDVGGLLLGVPRSTPRPVEQLGKHGVSAAVIVGRVLATAEIPCWNFWIEGINAYAIAICTRRVPDRIPTAPTDVPANVTRFRLVCAEPDSPSRLNSMALTGRPQPAVGDRLAGWSRPVVER